MRQLAGVQAVDRGVAPAVNGFTVCGGAKRVCCIVNQCEFVTSRDSLQGFMVTRLAVNVYREDGRRAWRNRGFYACGIKR